MPPHPEERLKTDFFPERVLGLGGARKSSSCLTATLPRLLSRPALRRRQRRRAPSLTFWDNDAGSKIHLPGAGRGPHRRAGSRRGRWAACSALTTP